jgi:hypothetical protein
MITERLVTTLELQGLADGTAFAELSAAAKLAWLLIVLPLAQFLEDATPLKELLESSQGQTDRFLVVHTHPQRHINS